MRLALAGLYCAMALLIAACGSTRQPRDAAKAGPPAQTTAAPAAEDKGSGARVTTHKTRFGRIVTDGSGRTLYVFTRDSAMQSRCYGRCARAWPPLLTRGTPTAANGAYARLLGTTKRHGGKLQVTYNGHPLYYYVGDRHPGEVLCQNVVEYGGRWLVADRAGQPVR